MIIRHGKTEFNKLGLFTGWDDAPLAEEGRAEAIKAGKLLKAHGKVNKGVLKYESLPAYISSCEFEQWESDTRSLLYGVTKLC